MKIFLTLLTILISLPSLAIDRAGLKSLLLQKGASLEALENKGYKSVLGETTGHMKSIPLSKVIVIVTENEAILRKEIEGTELNGAPVVGNLQSVRFNGRYINGSDVVGIIAAP